MFKTYYIFSTQYFPSSYGGVERYTYNLAKKLVEKGNHVTIITSNLLKIDEYEISEGVTIYRIPCFNLLKGRFPVIKFNKDFFRIVKNLKKIKPNLVIVNSRFYIHSLFGVSFAKKLKTKCLLIDHGTDHPTVNNKFLDPFCQIFEHFITFLIKHYCNDFYGVSRACNEWLNHFNIKAKSTLYNAIDIENINRIKQNRTIKIKEQYKLNEEDIIITFTGRLVKEKGILNLIDAMKLVNEKYKNVYLFIAGEGPLLDRIKEMKIKNIVVLGKIHFEEVVELLNDTDIFCLPSESEGFSTSVLEAVACNCLIITTKQGGSKELIINEDFGLIIDNNEAATIYSAILKALNEPVWKSKALENAYQRLINNFTWDITSDNVIKICEDVSWRK